MGDSTSARDLLRAAVNHVVQFHRGHLYPEYGREATDKEYLSAWVHRLVSLGEVISELGLTDSLSRKYRPEQFDAIQTRTLLLEACRHGNTSKILRILERLGINQVEGWKLENKLNAVGEHIRQACNLLEQALPTESGLEGPEITAARVDQGPQPVSSTPPAAKQDKEVDKRRVFVIHGRNKAAYDAMVLFLRSLGLDPWDFYQLSAESGGTAFIGDIVRRGMERSQAVVALFTPDEFAVLRPSLNDPPKRSPEVQRWQARPNVIYEAGMAMGIDEDHTILVTLGSDVSLFSDVSGVHIVQLDNTHEKRTFLRSKLQGVGCAVNLNTGEYLNTNRAGDFVKCIEFAAESPPGELFSGIGPTGKKPVTRRSSPSARGKHGNLASKASPRFEKEKKASVQMELGKLNPQEKEVLKRILILGGQTDSELRHHFYGSGAVSHGDPGAEVAAKCNLLERDFEGRWHVREQLVKLVEELI